MKTLITFTCIFVVFLTACAPIIPESGGTESTPIVITAEVSTAVSSGSINPFDTQTPSAPISIPTPVPPTPLPTLSSASLSPTELKYKILDQFPDFFFCDPDYYPVARADEGDAAQQRFPEIQADQEMFQTILSHNGLSGLASFTSEQMQLIYGDYKKLSAVYFELAGDSYQFQIRTGSDGKKGFAIKGTIDGKGSIDVQDKQPAFLTCPICLAVGTLIDTPQGAIRVEKLQVGDQVWTKNEAGQRIAGVILQTGSVRVPATHQIVHLVLSDGRELWASPGHPTADGRRLGDLKVGDMLDGARVSLIERLQYQGQATYDLLPSGATGFYWANEILIGSTLK
jgi:Hint domain-containing protein